MKQVLSPKDLADAIGVSESSLKRWADEGLVAVSRTAGGHRRIALAEAVRFIRDSGLPVLKPEVLGLTDLTAVSAPESIDSASTLLEEALVGGHAERVRGLVMSLYVSGTNLADICDGPIANAMRRIGELWKHSAEGIFIEHRATDLCVQALNHIRALLPPPAPDAPMAIGGSPGDDRHMLPSLMAATVLSADGWRESNLGGNTPFEVMAIAAQRTKARLVWVSCSMDQSEEELAPAVTMLADALRELGSSLVIGGRGVPRRLRGIPKTALQVSTLAELLAFARGLRLPSAPVISMTPPTPSCDGSATVTGGQ